MQKLGKDAIEEDDPEKVRQNSICYTVIALLKCSS